MDYNINALEKLASGYTADVFIIDDTKVLKLYNEGWNIKDIQNEFEVGKAMESYGISAPKVYDLVTCKNRHGIVFQRLENHTLMHKLLSQPASWKKQSRRMAFVHAQLNQIHDERYVLKDQKTFYKQMILSRTSIDETIKKQLLDKLAALPDGCSICHGDFHPMNLLFHKEQLYIIDWLGALRGNPLADVAGSYLIMQVMGVDAIGTNHSFLRTRIQTWAIHRFAAYYLQTYLSITHTDKKDIDEWIAIRAATYLDVGLSNQANQKLLSYLHTYLN